MAEFHHLKWDSEFMGFSVGKITSSDGTDLTRLIEKKRIEGYRLIYIFSTTKIESENSFLDEKITFRIKLTEKPSKGELQLYPDNFVSSELLETAIESGHYSRFNLDPDFPGRKFRELYSLWIEKSVSGKMADDIIIEELNGYLAGIITVKIEGEVGKIGLMATRDEYRNLGIGKKLLNNCKFYCTEKGCKYLKVTTQKINIRACNFYNKNGFETESVQYIYHRYL